MKGKILLLLLFVMAVSCSNLLNVPDNVKHILDKAGSNQNELIKVIQHYKQSEDSLKLNAAYFLIGNMDTKCYIHYIISDSNGTDVNFNVLDYPDYSAMIAAWDSVETVKGKISNKIDTVIYDYNKITSDYLIENIDFAFKAWQENPWAKHINFDQFCEYILPYRVTNEPLEEWREYFYNKYNWVKDSLVNKDDPVEATILINNDLMSWFSFDSRFYNQKRDQGLKEMLKNKMARCEGMTNLTSYAMRAVGIPVTSDFTPYWAKTGNNHAWNVIIDKNGKGVIFMGALKNPGEYELLQAKAKVYRTVFSKQSSSLAEVKEEWEKVPPYIDRNNIVDVTRDYVPVADANITLEKEVPDSVNYAYLCVFNSGKWKALAWSKIYKNRKTKFSEMGTDIAYLAAYYINKKIIPASKPFILTEKGENNFLEADKNKLTTLKLISTTAKITKEATDDIRKHFLNIGKNYKLLYWDKDWKSLGTQKAGEGALIFKNVPTNALYWLVEENSRKEERIFIIDADGKQVWY